MKIMGLLDAYHYVNDELADWRTNDWFLVSSPLPIVLITFSYLYFIYKCGPEYMEDRRPYKLYGFIRLYNIVQIVTNVLVVYAIFENGWYEDYFLHCVEIDLTDSPRAMKYANLAWYIMLLKIFDYVETGVMVLRKKQRQISFLHVYHHAGTALLAWLHVKYFTNGITQIMYIVNCSIHVIMYSYYLISSIESMRRMVEPIKRGITILQIVQFVAVIVHSARAFVPGCPNVKVVSALLIIHLSINLILFLNFYRENYSKKQKQK